MKWFQRMPQVNSLQSKQTLAWRHVHVFPRKFKANSYLKARVPPNIHCPQTWRGPEFCHRRHYWGGMGKMNKNSFSCQNSREAYPTQTTLIIWSDSVVMLQLFLTIAQLLKRCKHCVSRTDDIVQSVKIIVCFVVRLLYSCTKNVPGTFHSEIL